MFNISHFETACLSSLFNVLLVTTSSFLIDYNLKLIQSTEGHSWYLNSCYLFELDFHCFPPCSHISIICFLCCFSDTQSLNCLGDLTVASASMPKVPTWLIPRVIHSFVLDQSYLFIATPAVCFHTH